MPSPRQRFAFFSWPFFFSGKQFNTIIIMSSALSADFVRYWQIIMMMMKKIASANHKVPLNFKIHHRPTAALFQKQSKVNGNLKKNIQFKN